MIIAIDGAPGTGKTRIIDKLKVRYEGYPVDFLTFPLKKSDPIGEVLTEHEKRKMQEGGDGLFSDEVVALLYSSEYTISKKLVDYDNDPDKILILDRYILTLLAENQFNRETMFTIWEVLRIAIPDMQIVIQSPSDSDVLKSKSEMEYRKAYKSFREQYKTVDFFQIVNIRSADGQPDNNEGYRRVYNIIDKLVNYKLQCCERIDKNITSVNETINHIESTKKSSEKEYYAIGIEKLKAFVSELTKLKQDLEDESTIVEMIQEQVDCIVANIKKEVPEYDEQQ